MEFQSPWTTQILNDQLFEELQENLPLTSDATSPQSPLSTGIAAVERRAFSRRASPYRSQFEGRADSPLSDRGALVQANIDHGLRSTSSSPNPARTGHIRRAAPPPLQPKAARPTSELFLPTPSANKRMTIFTLPDPILENAVEEEMEEPPPLSPVSSALAKARFSRLDVHASVRHAIANLDNSDFSSHHLRAIYTPAGNVNIPRASTAPPSIIRQLSSATLRSTRSLPNRTSSIRAGGSSSRGAGVRPLTALRKAGVRFSGIDKDILADKRATAALAKRRTDFNEIVGSPQTPSSVTPQVKRTLSAIPLPWRRRRRGETMSMLVGAGFFPIKELIYNSDGKKEMVFPGRRGRPALTVEVGDLSNVPLSIVGTPIEFYHRGALSPRRRTNYRKTLAPRRRFIGQRLSYLPSLTPPLSSSSSCSDSTLSLSPLTPTTPRTALSALTASAFTTESTSPIFLSRQLLEAIEEDADPITSATMSSSVTISPSSLEMIPEDVAVAAPSTNSPPVPVSSPDTATTTAIVAKTMDDIGSEIFVPNDVVPNDALKDNALENLTTENITPEYPSIPTDPTQSTSIQLSSGAVITVSPPEASPWLRSVYIQGQIKLPTPLVVPRKNSIATLAPFQDAVDAAYQDTVPGCRRNSDGVVVEDVLEWYGDWGFDNDSFEPDAFTGAEVAETEAGGVEMEEEARLAPIEAQVAAQMMEGSSQEAPIIPVSLSGSMVPVPASPGSPPEDLHTGLDLSPPRERLSDTLARLNISPNVAKLSAEYDVDEIRVTPITAYKPAWSPPEEWSGNDIEEKRRSRISSVMSRASEVLSQRTSAPASAVGHARQGSMETTLANGTGKKFVRTKRVKRFVQAATAMEEVGRL